MCEFHSALQHVMCTYRYWQCSHSQCVSFIVPNSMWCASTDTDSVPTHNVWVSQCPTACGVHVQILTVFPLTVCEFHSAQQHVVCIYGYWHCSHTQCVSFSVPHSMWCAPTDTGSVPTHSMWVSQCPTACGVHIRYWQCSPTQCVSFTVPYSMWCVPADTVFPHTHCLSFAVPDSMWCAPADTDNVPTHNVWVLQCPAACVIHVQILTMFAHTMCEFHIAPQHMVCTL
jgi:hypothetical protein